MNTVLAVILLSSCGSYKPPYQRGYDEGYQAGYTAAGGAAAQVPEQESGQPVSDPDEKSAIQSILSVKDDTKQQEEAVQETETIDAAEGAGEGTEADTVAEEDTGETVEASLEIEAEEASSEVLGDGSQPAESGGGQSAIPDGRVISAEAVNEALYSHPEVIDGLRDLYTDTAIFGEYVGDSETNLLHKVNGPHFAELTYNTIVVFDGSKSVDDILNEGFFTKCSCCDQ